MAAEFCEPKMGIKKSPKAQRLEKEDKRGKIYIGLVIIGLLILIGIYLNAMSKKQGIDPTTNCPTKGISRHTAILIDTTDEYNLVQKTWVSNQLRKIVKETKQYEKISVYTIDEIYKETPLPLQSKCNPGDASNINKWTENERMKQEEWQKKFIEPLESVFNNLLNKGKSNSSPIMEMIQAISIAAFQSNFSQIGKKLFIFSDMIQNSSEYSHYKDSPQFRDFYKSPKYLKLRTNLKDVAVQIFYVRRPGSEGIQGKAHAEFWANYFKSMNARLEPIIATEG